MAQDDIATLAIRADVSQLQDAVRRLEDLSRASRNAEHTVGGLERQMRDCGAGASSLCRAMWDSAKGVLGLVAAFKSLSAASDFMKRGVEYNSSLEQSQIGIASLITSMVKLGNAQGKALEGVEKYQAAQGLAADMMKEIQRLGLETTATTETLVAGVQSIMGPAIQAGMSLKDIPRFAVEGAQAMQTLGIPLEQMRTELEALLSGNINKAQDILAPKLFSDVKGSLSEYIGKLRDSGKLMDEIFKRLEPFRLAGKDVAQTWSGLTSNFSEALDTLAGQSAKNLSKSLKESVNIMSELVLTTEKESVGISDKFKGIADVITTIETKIGEGIAGGVKTVADLVEKIGAYINSKGSDNFLADISQYATMAIAGLTALIVARKAANAEFTTSNGTQITGLRNYITAQREANRASAELAASELRRATSLRDATRSELEQYHATMQYRTANLSAAEAGRVRATMQNRLIQLQNAATAAELRYNAALMQGTIIGRTALSLRTAMSGVMRLLGGPLGATITLATVGFSYLATRQSEAEKSANLLAQAEKNYQEVLEGSKKNTDEYVGKLTELQEAKRRLAKQQAEEAIKGYKNVIEKELDNVALDPYGIQSSSGGWGNMNYMNVDKTLQNYQKRVKDLYDAYDTGKIKAEEMVKGLADISNEMSKGEYASSDLAKALEKIIKDKTLEDLARAENQSHNLAGGLNAVAGEAGNAGTQIRNMVNAFNLTAATDFVEKMKGNIRDMKLKMQGLGKQVAVGKVFKDASETDIGSWNKDFKKGGVLQLSKNKSWNEYTAKNEYSISDKFNAYSMFATMKEEAETEKALEKYNESQKTSGGGKSAANAAEKAEDKVKSLRREIDELNGVASKDSNSLAKKLQEIDALGKNSKVSASEVSKLKTEYKEAFQAKTLKDFNKEMLEATGNTAALQSIAIGDKVKEWENNFQAMGLSAEEATDKVKPLKEALENKQKYEDAQTAVQFFNEMSSMGARYAMGIDEQNKLLEYQAAMYRDKLPAELQKYIDVWLKLKQEQESRDPFAGLSRGLRKYGDDATDMAKGLENAMSNACQGMEDAFVNFAQTGKLSFTDLANSIISDLMRIAVRSAITGPIANALGGLFSLGSGTPTSGFSGTSSNSIPGLVGPAIPNGVYATAKGGVFSGGNLSGYSGSIVSSPTYFSYSDHIRKFARGAGLMGEAGPEAIMPLERLGNGRLGVGARIAYDYPRMSNNENTGKMPVVNITINNNGDNEVSTKQSMDNDGNMNIDILLEQKVSDLLSRPGSRPFRTMQSTWQGQSALAKR